MERVKKWWRSRHRENKPGVTVEEEDGVERRALMFILIMKNDTKEKRRCVCVYKGDVGMLLHAAEGEGKLCLDELGLELGNPRHLLGLLDEVAIPLGLQHRNLGAQSLVRRL